MLKVYFEFIVIFCNIFSMCLYKIFFTIIIIVRTTHDHLQIVTIYYYHDIFEMNCNIIKVQSVFKNLFLY